MKSLITILKECTALGHDMVNDPPFIGGTRYSCVTCGRAVIRSDQKPFWYGSALTFECVTRKGET